MSQPKNTSKAFFRSENISNPYTLVRPKNRQDATYCLPREEAYILIEEGSLLTNNCTCPYLKNLTTGA